MNKFAKMIAVCGLFLGGLMFAAPAMAQGDANTNKEKTVSKTEVVSTPAAKTCSGAAASKACCASKGSANASGGEMKVTSVNAGSNGATCNKAAATSCTKASASTCTGSKAMGGEVSETSANAGKTSKTTKACKTSGKACCASKKAEGTN
jgi:hypothetical protein